MMKGTHRKLGLPYSSERLDGTGSTGYGTETQQLHRSVANPGLQKLPESGHRFLIQCLGQYIYKLDTTSEFVVVSSPNS